VVDHLIGYRNLSSISDKSIRNNPSTKVNYRYIFYS